MHDDGDELVAEQADQREQIQAQDEKRPLHRRRHGQSGFGEASVDGVHLFDLLLWLIVLNVLAIGGVKHDLDAQLVELGDASVMRRA